MAEYIEREALLNEAKKRAQAFSVALIYEAIKEAPACDVVEVVRCGECKYNVANMEKDPLDATDYSGTDIVCSYFMTDGLHPDDFCSKAERSEGC